MQESSTRKIYDLHSGFYDVTFGRLVKKRIARAVRQLDVKPGERVLDLGIGTGVSLHFHRRDVGQVVGVDLSAGMLAECGRKVREMGLANVTLVRANALHLPFEASAFDHVFCSHVISVVSDPARLVREAQRVARPGARVVLLNHFQSTNRVVGTLERWVSPLCSKIGWRSDLALADVVRETGIEIDYRYKHSSVDLWETVVFANDKGRRGVKPRLQLLRADEAPAV